MLPIITALGIILLRRDDRDVFTLGIMSGEGERDKGFPRRLEDHFWHSLGKHIASVSGVSLFPCVPLVLG